jgi:ketosteroid isomerase-like protein
MAEGRQVVEQAYEAFGRGDIPAVLGVLAEDVEWSVPEVVPHGGRFRGRDDVGRFFQGIGEKWEPGFSVDAQEWLEGGDEVSTIGRAEGTLQGGGPAGYGFVHVFTVRGGEVVRFREYVDADGSLRGG